MTPATKPSLEATIREAEQSAAIYRHAERKNGPSLAMTQRHLRAAALLTRLYLQRTAARCPR